MTPVSLSLYPHSRQQKDAAAIIATFTALAVLCVCLRVYARVQKHQYGLDDFLVCLAMPFLIAESVATYIGMRTLFNGVPKADIPIELGISYGMLWIYISQILYNPILALVKTSVLCFLLRLGAGLNPGIRWTIHFVNAWNILQGIAIFLVVIFQCTPASFYWLEADPTSTMKGHCIHQGTFYVVTAGLTILTDLLVLALPIRIFGGLQMKLKLRVAVIGLFCLGGSVVVISALRLQWNYNLNFGTLSNEDIGGVYTPIECSLAVMASCGPALRPLVARWFFPSLAETTGAYGGSSGNIYRQYPSTMQSNGIRRQQRVSMFQTSTSGKETEEEDEAWSSRRGHNIPLKDMRSTAEVEAGSAHGSEDGMVPRKGIMMTREYNVKSESDSVRKLTHRNKEERV